MSAHSRTTFVRTPTPTVTSTAVAQRPSGLDAPAPPFTRLVGVELRKSVNTVTGRWLLIITGLLVLGALALGAYFPPPGQDANLQSLLSTALIPMSLLLPVLGVLLMSGEFSTRSILTTFALVPSRGQVVAAKTAAAMLLATTGAVLTTTLGVAAAGALDLTGQLGGWSIEPANLLQILTFQLVYVLVGVGFGLLWQNTPLAVVTYLVVPLLLSTVIMLIPALRDIGPWIDLTAGLTPLTEAGAANADNWAKAASVTAIWAGVPLILGWLRLRRREIA